MPNVTMIGGQREQGPSANPTATSTATSMRSRLPQTGMGMLGASVGQGPPPPPGGSPGGPVQGPPRMGPGSTNLSDLANYLGRAYGINIGGKGLVDEQGTFLQTPQNADEAAKFNLISQRIADEQTRGYENKAVAALQSETGLLRNRQAGSLARVQAGTYRQLAQTYSSTEVTPSNFNYWIQKEMFDKQMAFQEKLFKQAKKSAKYAAIGGGIGAIAGFAFGGVIGAGAGAGAGQGIGQGLAAF